MTITEIIDIINEKKIANSKVAPTAVEDFLRKTLTINTYVPFSEKRRLIELVVKQNIKEIDGIKYVDSVSQYISFLVAMIVTHTDLTVSNNPIDDYDLLNKNGILEIIISFFQKDYDECNTLLKMVVAQELESNNLNSVVSKFLNGIIDKIDGVGEVVKNTVGNINLKDMLGDKINKEDLANILGFIDKLK